MATTPRYLATTAADARTYLEASLDAETYLVVFDSDRDGAITSASADETELVRAVCRAETKVDRHLGASHGAPWSAEAFAALDEGTRDAIRECVQDLCLWERVKLRTPMTDKKSPFRQLWEDAEKSLKELAADRGNRLPGQSAPEPTSGATGVVEADEDDSPTWTNIAAGNTTIGF